ncbi:MAG: ABC transporter substrate-binding protein [Rhodocyclaceae bacterium]|nr:ABC transporter substrate-binding protein [Rhodocyclaceae bacterium]
MTKRLSLIMTVGLSMAASGLCTLAVADEQFIPVASFRVGPVGGVGIAVFGGYLDYFELINRRDGGVNGVKLTWEECETEYKVERGVECYERLKKKGPTGPSFFNFNNGGITYAVTERATQDKIPVMSIGSGRVDSADGRIFPYFFQMLHTLWGGSMSHIKFIASREGGIDKLKGKKIVNLYLGNTGGKENIASLDTLSKRYGFELTHIEATPPGAELQSQFLQIRQIKPDWLILHGWGVMAPTAIKTAAKVGFPVDRMIGAWPTNSNESVIPAGDVAKGFMSITFSPGGAQYPVIQDIQKQLYSGGAKGNVGDPKLLGNPVYNSGVLQAMIGVEAIRVAQGRFGKKSLTPEQVRWGFEHLNIDEKRIRELGAEGLLQPLKTSCADHQGGGAVKVVQWDGTKWNVISDWIYSDKALERAMVEAEAAKYAKEKGITPRDCSKES